MSGKQADGARAAGSVSVEALELLLEGRDPARGTPLGYPLADRTLTDGRVVGLVAGFRRDVLCAEVAQRAVGVDEDRVCRRPMTRR